MSEFLQKIKVFMKKFLAIVILLGAGVMAFLYWGTYENGVMAGKVLSVTERGFLFKTHEGKMSVESFGALKGVSPIAETRDFSVEPTEEEVLKILQEVSLSGERVNLKFKRRFMKFFWRGETKYFVVEVERTSIPPTPPTPPQPQ
jgi:hypothetical protein